MAFDSFRESYYKSIGGEKDVAFVIPENKKEAVNFKNGQESIRKIIPMLKQKFPAADNYGIHYQNDNIHSFYVEVSNSDGL
ncbi:hypothetical protein [Autumnicola musiva]|uniref:Uncharacterized protein n=1 Tax=Autumnicola musiva TaxID=3075589 RepID=A0ABU3DAZ4_9FLAO|nr:hypothetical protein [Zunongwangia sp. F117]MDT0678705.1 hypothetical protein [Zunongwangia sp. F117]